VSKHKVLVASVCPQSLPFFAVKFGVDVSEAAHKLCGFLKSLGEWEPRRWLRVTQLHACYKELLNEVNRGLVHHFPFF